MCEIKTILVSVCLILLVTASFCIYWVYPEKNLGQHSEMKLQNPCENECKDYCLNGGECCYLVDEDIVGCVCTCFFGAKHFQKICGGLSWDFISKLIFHEIVRVLKLLIRNLTREFLFENLTSKNISAFESCSLNLHKKAKFVFFTGYIQSKRNFLKGQFYSKSDFLKKLWNKIWQVVKMLF